MRLGAGELVVALVPAAALIGLGLALRRRLRFPPDFWGELERLAYFVLLPALFVSGLARADFRGLQVGPMVLVLAVSSIAGAVIAWGLRPLIAPGDGPAYSSVFQGGVRFNNYIGLVVATALLGGQGLGLAALCNAVLVPVVNVTSTVTLARHGHGATRWPDVARQVATNPLVVACLVGILLRYGGRAAPVAALLDLPGAGELVTAAGELVRILGMAALPVGLLCVGAGLRRPEGTGGTIRLIGWSMALRFLLLPALAAGCAVAVQLRGPAAVVAVLFQSVPTATSSYILARRLGGDAHLMAAIIAVQTVAGLVTIPLWLLAGQALSG